MALDLDALLSLVVENLGGKLGEGVLVSPLKEVAKVRGKQGGEIVKKVQDKRF